MDTLPDFMTENDDGSITVELRKGLTVTGETRKSITMREPTVADTMAAKTTGRDDDGLVEITLIANLAEVPPESIKNTVMKDYVRLQASLAFLHG